MEGWLIAVIVCACVILVLILLRLFIFMGKYTTPENMSNKIVIITGCSAGIGKMAAFELLKYGATVIFACRDEKKTLNVINETKDFKSVYSDVSCFERSVYMHLQLNSFKSVKEFANNFKKKYNKLDILINNAGFITSKFNLTEDGLEEMIQTNHYSHVLLTLLLKDVFNKNDAKIINVSSEAHNFSNYEEKLLTSFSKECSQFKEDIDSGMKGHLIAYGNTKLANIYFTKYLQDLSLEDSYKHLHAFSLHPGGVNTEISSRYADSCCAKFTFYLIYPFFWYFSKTETGGAQTTLHLCYTKNSDLINGGYYDNCEIGKLNKIVQRNDLCSFLNKETMRIITPHLDN